MKKFFTFIFILFSLQAFSQMSYSGVAQGREPEVQIAVTQVQHAIVITDDDSQYSGDLKTEYIYWRLDNDIEGGTLPRPIYFIAKHKFNGSDWMEIQDVFIDLATIKAIEL